MQKREKIINIVSTCLPYLIIVVAAFISTFVYFNDGLARGDDIKFHLSMVNDVVYGFKHGYFLISTNHIFMGGFAINNFGFYGPVTHYAAAIFTMMFEWVGADVIFGLKAVVILSSIMGGVFMYFLALKISNKNRIVSLIAALLFIFLPYRIFCALCRCAYAESVAICFVPVVFFGAYSIVHDEEYSVMAYVSLAVGAIGIILTHAFTGMIVAFFGVLYMLANIHRLIKKRKGFSIWPSVGVTVIVILFCVGFYVTNSLYYKNTGLYNLSDEARMWTTYDHVADSARNSYAYSGFLNFIVINGWVGKETWNNSTVSTLIFDVVIYFASIMSAIMVNELFKRLPKNIYYRYISAVLTSLILPIIFQVRIEVWLSLIVSLVLFLSFTVYYEFLYKEKDEEQLSEKGFSLVKEPDFWFSVVALFICLLFCLVGGVWEHLPSIMYQAQFAWRMWGIIIFFVSLLFTILISKFKCNKPLVLTSIVFVSSLIALSMGVLEKRVYYEKRSEEAITEAGEEYVKGIRFSGAQNEMVPMIFYDNKYQATYPNSLFSYVKNAIHSRSNFCYSLEEYKTPVFLDGEGTIEITEYNSPNNSFKVNIISETSLVQFPQFYYDGYYAYRDGNEIAKGENVDGLLTLSLEKGEYTFSLSFKESKYCEVLHPFSFVGYGLLVSGGVFGIFYRTKIIPAKLKKEQEEK